MMGGVTALLLHAIVGAILTYLHHHLLEEYSHPINGVDLHFAPNEKDMFQEHPGV